MLTTAQVKQIFGTFSYINYPDGSISITNDWIDKNIVSFKVSGKTVRCHKLVQQQLEAALNEATQYIIWKDSGMGCFVPRHVLWKLYKELSRHSWGIAIDLNPIAYPYGSYKPQNPNLISIMKKYGFEIVVAKDQMHFEFVRFIDIGKEEIDMSAKEEIMDEMRKIREQMKQYHEDCVLVEMRKIREQLKEYIDIKLKEMKED